MTSPPPLLMHIAYVCPLPPFSATPPPTCEGGMYRVLSQHLAVYTVVGGGGDGPDHIRGVDVLDVRITLSGSSGDRWR